MPFELRLLSFVAGAGASDQKHEEQELAKGAGERSHVGRDASRVPPV
jgi:hypothetical protein